MLDVRSSIAACLSALLLGGCAGDALSPASALMRTAGARLSPAKMRQAATDVRWIYGFKKEPDGRWPYAPLTVLDGAFYGTTERGGAHDKGTVYEVQPDGSERVLHSFSGPPADGSYPTAGLIERAGSLYGVTQHGGTNDRGAFFDVKRDGTYRQLYSFSDANGSLPKSELIAVAGVFFGTTARGGTDNFGTVFSMTAEGQEHVLHSFTGLHGGGRDGRAPEGRLELLGRNLYGTTSDGGAHDLGTVFEIASNGKERVLYNFQGNDTGYYPNSGPTVVNGSLYGATLRGGNSDLGAIYEVKTDGSGRVVHSFSGNGADGTYPRSELALYKGLLYGTASSGGFNRDGTVFEVNPAGGFRVLHHFKGFLSTHPWAGLIVHNGKLYGTTKGGPGPQRDGNGAVYEIAP
jgi:uncharacterized repeat protein (TIGR03803 family)